MIASALAWAVGNVVAKRAAKYDDDMFALVVWSSLVPPIPLALMSYAFEGGATVDARAIAAGESEDVVYGRGRHGLLVYVGSRAEPVAQSPLVSEFNRRPQVLQQRQRARDRLFAGERAPGGDRSIEISSVLRAHGCMTALAILPVGRKSSEVPLLAKRRRAAQQCRCDGRVGMQARDRLEDLRQPVAVIRPALRLERIAKRLARGADIPQLGLSAADR